MLDSTKQFIKIVGEYFRLLPILVMNPAVDVTRIVLSQISVYRTCGARAELYERRVGRWSMLHPNFSWTVGGTAPKSTFGACKYLPTNAILLILFKGEFFENKYVQL